MSAKNVKKALADYEASAPAQSPYDNDPNDSKNDPYDETRGKRPEPWRNGEMAKAPPYWALET